MTSETVRPALAEELERDPRGRPREAGTRPHLAAAGAGGRARPRRRRSSTCARTTTSGSPINPEVVAAAHAAIEEWGFGLASVRFICGTQELHKDLEAALSEFLGTEDTILYSSCFDANGGLFEMLLGEQDAVISDELNHASIIDGVRLWKAQRFRYRNNDMDDLEATAEGGRGSAAPADRHRRRVLDGRLPRQPAGDLRPGRAA